MWRTGIKRAELAHKGADFGGIVCRASKYKSAGLSRLPRGVYVQVWLMYRCKPDEQAAGKCVTKCLHHGGGPVICQSDTGALAMRAAAAPINAPS